MQLSCNDGKLSRNMPHKRLQNLLLLVTLFSGVIILFCINYNPGNFPKIKEVYIPSEYSYDEKFTIKTQGCQIAAMLPVNELIEKYVRYPHEMKPCPNTNYSLLVQNGTHIRLNKDPRVLRHYNIPVRKHRNIRCCYSSFYRPDDIPDIHSHKIDERIKYNECNYFNDVVEVKDEFVSVSCNYQGHEIYNQYYLFVPFKNLTINNDEKNEINKKTEKTEYNVLVVGIDNLSRLNFHRTMPKTAAFMKNHGAVELLGYNKVGDNSFPNLVPLLMGYAAEEIKQICHPMKWTTYDDCPFLWHWYKDAGFYTAFGEDSGKLGTFNYIMKGFRKTPTDYYLHPFIAEAERVGGTNEDGNVFLCVYEHYLYQILLDYIIAITDTLWDEKLFGFFWETTVTHDYLNYPMVIDESYFKFFNQIKQSNYLDNTIVFLISDHGIRWGDFRKTNQGYLEERLPLAFVLTPTSFREEFNEAFNNLEYNSKQLTTPFDLHETLLDLINLENLRNETIVKRTKRNNPNKRGISLFLKVPEDRTCSSAGIADHWCSCYRRVSVSNSSGEIMNASKFLIEYLNSFLQGYPQCITLALDEIQKSTRFEANVEDNLQFKWSEYSITLKVKPSGGIFEATLRDYGDNWSVIGTVSRLNLYGNQSICVNDPRVKLYCFCEENENI